MADVAASPLGLPERPLEDDATVRRGRPEPAAVPVRPLPREAAVAIVGAGFAGLGMAIRLRERGIEDFVVLERAADVGGTWHANAYPGCQCDIPSNLYSFSFAPRPDWSHAYPEQPQIEEYLRGCARRFGVLDHTHLRCELLEATWIAEERRWRLVTSHGTLTARVLITATGTLSEPSVPRIAGLDGFAGAVFHTAAWDREHDFRGERIGLIGTGASAIQVGPRLQRLAARLHVFQRTPPWVIPHPDRAIPPAVQRLYARAPALQRLVRLGVYIVHEALVPGLTRDPRGLLVQKAAAQAMLRAQVRDPALRARLTPSYSIGCKRIVLSNDWYPALTAPNAELVTDPIARVEERAIVTRDGTTRELDALVLATGFTPTDPPIARRLRGADGRTLRDVWDGSPQAYLGTTVAGFPNLFVLYGPNTNLGHSSIVYMLESQIHYVLEALRAMRARGAVAAEVRPEVQDAYNAELQARLVRSVWNTGGCGSWYLDARGRNSTMWPGFTWAFRRRLRTFDPADYRMEAAA